MLWLDRLKGFREIGAYLMMGVLALSILNGLIRLFDTADWDPGFAARAYFSYGSFTHALAVVVLTLLVLSLATQTPKSPRTGMVALIGAILTGIGALAIFLLGLIGIGAETFASGLGRFSHILTWLITLVIPVVATVVLLLIYLGVKPAPAYQHPQQYGSQPGPGQVPGQMGTGQSPFPQQGMHQPVVPQQQQPTWQPDQASGGAWQSAGQAASGASASEWGQPGQQQGWVPQPAPEPPAQPQQQGWTPPQSASEPPAPQQQWGQQPAEQQWQPIDPNQPGGGQH